MTMPTEDQDVTPEAAGDDHVVPVPVAKDDAVVSTTPLSVGAEAIAAARAIIAQEREDAKNDVWVRSKRTMLQSALAAAAVAGVNLYVTGVHGWPELANAAGQAALTVVITYFHGRAKPAK